MVDGEAIDGEPLADGDLGEGGRSRAGSTVTYDSDNRQQRQDGVDDEMPMPVAGEDVQVSAGAKRPRDGADDEGDGERADRAEVDDPDMPVDGEAGSVERPGRYDICELFSPARVTKAAAAAGLRGGWSLDLNHVDPITGCTWDLSTEKDQGRC